jgi:hypothetical protein
MLMRRLAFLTLGLSLGLAALSEDASARPRGLSGLFGMITKPIGSILRPPRGISRRATHRRPAATRTRQARPGAAESRSAAAAPVAQNASTAPAAAAGVAGATAVAATAGAAPSPGLENAPTAAPSQRSTAVTQPTVDEAQQRRREAARGERTVPQATLTAAAPSAPTQLGLVGPPTWPTAFEDILGFTLWPDRYGERLRAHGIGDVMSVLFAPPVRAAAGSGQPTARAKPDGLPASDAGSTASPCPTNQAPSDWPAKPLEQAMTLNDVQRAALDEFRTAVGDAVAAIQATCRDAPPDSSAERLQGMQRALWAVRDAVMLVRAPLINFYRSLSDEQKQRFIIETKQPDPRLAQMQQRATQGRGARPQIPRDLARMCGMSAANEWPLRQIEQAIQPNNQQKASLEALQKKSTEMGQLLVASCLQPIAVTPEARLDQALDRLTAMLFAITNITLALNDFHGQLSADQKVKLEPFGL